MKKCPNPTNNPNCKKVVKSEKATLCESCACKGLIRIYNEELNKERRVKEEELLQYFKEGYKLGRRPFTKEHIENISKSHEGISLSKEHAKSISEASKGKIPWNKGLTKETHLSLRIVSEKMKNNKNGSGKRSEETKRKLRLAIIKNLERDKFNGGQASPWYNSDGCKYFNLLMEQTNTYIQHAQNGGEFYIKELGYWVDGYDKENNIIYEYDEEHHYENGILRKKDIQRQKEITEYLNCKFIRIKA